MPTKTNSKPSATKRKSKPPPAKLAIVEASVGTSVETLKRDPTHDEIAFRAFELYQLRAHADGGALNDWLAAEQELRAS